MSMTTQCPSCSTTFRVTPQQLQSQQGMVRCGRCATVFDGFKALATLPEDVRAEPARAAPAPVEMPEPVSAPTDSEIAAAVAGPATPEIDATVAEEPAEAPLAQTVGEENTAVAEPEHGAPEAATTGDAEIQNAELPDAASENAAAPLAEPESAAEPTIINAPPSAPADQLTAPQPLAIDDAYLTPPSPAPARRGAVWAVASIILALALGAQLTYLYRGEIAASVPEARPLLTDWCKTIGCTVALPQRPRQISIEASDMPAADTANSGLIVLTATLRNQATITLGYPALDVVLTNTRDHTVARRIFLPGEYLADVRESRAGIAPSAEITIRLNIDSGDLGAAGFRLELMAAPAG